MIKKILTIISFVSFLSCFAQYNALSADFIGPITYAVSNGESGRIGVFYEKTLNRSWSLNVSFNQFFEKGSPTGVVSADFGYYGLLFSSRFYPCANRKPAPLGFFLEPNLTYNKMKKGYYTEEGLETYSGNHASIGLSLGYKARITQQIFLDFIFGYGYSYLYDFENNEERKFLAEELDINYDDLDREILPFRIFFNLGYVFPKVEGVAWNREKNKKTWIIFGFSTAVAILRAATLGQN